jgi:hypothetical protein
MKSNPVVWFEIYVQNMERAKAFYECVFAIQLEKLETEVSPFSSGDQSHNRGDKGISGAVAGIAAIDPETPIGELMGERAAHIGEGIFGPTRGGVAPRGGLLQAGPVDPSDGGGHHAEVQMVGDRIGVAGLRLGTADLLLDFSKSGFDFPARAVNFNYLRNG